MYYLLYELDCGKTWELVSGEDAMHVRVYELMCQYNLQADDIIVIACDPDFKVTVEGMTCYII